LYEKSRLIIQTYNNNRKEMILMQSFIIKRANQQVIIILAFSIIQLKKDISL
jgi:hypothetical protein